MTKQAVVQRNLAVIGIGDVLPDFVRYHGHFRDKHLAVLRLHLFHLGAVLNHNLAAVFALGNRFGCKLFIVIMRAVRTIGLNVTERLVARAVAAANKPLARKTHAAEKVVVFENARHKLEIVGTLRVQLVGKIALVLAEKLVQALVAAPKLVAH